MKRTPTKKIRGWKNKYRMFPKVSHITPDGFCLHTYKKDYYIVYTRAPFFKLFQKANASQLRDVILEVADPERPDEHGDILYWNSLDISLGITSIEYPELFDIFARHRKALQPCPHCGHDDVFINYRYLTNYKRTAEYPHDLFIYCPHCHVQTLPLQAQADDDYTSITLTLAKLTDMWHRLIPFDIRSLSHLSCSYPRSYFIKQPFSCVINIR